MSTTNTDGDDKISAELNHLISRDTDKANFPDKIIAIGGGGRKMVLEMFKQDWFALEAMKGRSNDINVAFIDTATENKHNHSVETEELKSRCQELHQVARQETSSGIDICRINIDDYIVTEKLNIANETSFTGKGVIDSVKQNTGAEHWWIDDRHLRATDGSRNFYDVSAGAVKRRALGKALHYKGIAQITDQSYRNLLTDLASGERVAIFSGLGGGTGSGLFIDVARLIESQHKNAQINLFASMPSTDERNEAKANAMAALSELEYMQLKRDTPFNQIFLFPLAPTGLESETTDEPELVEFDKAVSYAVLGVYNSQDADYAFVNTTRYAPFTIAIPQVLHYSLEEIKNRKNEIHEVLGKKRELLNLESYYFQQIRQYLDDQYPKTSRASGEDLSEEAQDYLTERLNHVERIINSSLLEKLEIEISSDTSLQEFRGRFNELVYPADKDPKSIPIENILRYRELEELILDLDVLIEDYNIQGGLVDQYAEFSDDYLRDVLFTEINSIIECARLLLKLREAQMENVGSDGDYVETDADLKVLELFLLPNTSSAKETTRRKSLKKAIRDTEENLNDTNTDIDRLREEIKAEKQRIKNKSSETKEQLRNQCQAYIRDYEKLSNLNIDTEVQNVEAEANNIAREATSGNRVSTDTLKQKINKLENTIKVNFISDVSSGNIDSNDIATGLLESAELVREAKQQWDDLEREANESGGIVNRLMGGDDDNRIDTQQYSNVRRQIDNDWFDVPNAPSTERGIKNVDFEVSYVGDILSDINGQIETIENNLEEEIANVYDKVVNNGSDSGGSGGIVGSQTASSTSSELKQLLQTSDSSNMMSIIEEKVDDDIRTQLDTNIESKEKILDEKKQDIDRLEKKLNRLEEGENYRSRLNQEADRPVRNMYSEFLNKFGNKLLDLPQGRGNLRHEIENSYQQQVTPADLARAVKKQSLVDSGLLSDTTGGVTQERREIRDSLLRIINQRVLQRDYNGLSESTLVTQDVTAFEDAGVYVAYAGEAVSSSSEDNRLNSSDFDEIKQRLQEHFDLGAGDENLANQYDSWRVNNGDPWEVGMCVYIQGISFLDNLTHVRGGTSGYWSRYQKLTKEYNQSETVARHAYNLENSKYVIRDSLVDINGNPEYFLENDNEYVADDILDNRYIVRDLRTKKRPESDKNE